MPPRLVLTTVPDAADFARRAGRGTRQAGPGDACGEGFRAGVPGDIHVSTSSGNTQADALAIEYARVLRWNPAQEKGRKSIANIRLPVVLAASD